MIRYELSDAVAIITMDRPEARNALDSAMREGLWDAFRRFAGEEGARVAILTGTGPVFCAGADLKEMSATQMKVPPPDFLPQLGRNLETDKPVIAAVNGHAIAGGFLLAQMCDLCIATETATFGIAEARWGRGAPWAAPLTRLVGPRLALELLLTGETISAQRAYETGFVNKVVADQQALAVATQKMAATIAQNAPLSVRASKAMVQMSSECGEQAALRQADRIFESVYLSEDAQEGPLAFRQKRKPQWKGR